MICNTIEIGDYICSGTELGSGSFSQVRNIHRIHPKYKVYKGHHKATGLPVAIKVIDNQKLDEKELEYHFNERETWKKLGFHENIVKLYDVIVNKIFFNFV